jgi:hypothetical protein
MVEVCVYLLIYVVVDDSGKQKGVSPNSPDTPRMPFEIVNVVSVHPLKAQHSKQMLIDHEKEKDDIKMFRTAVGILALQVCNCYFITIFFLLSIQTRFESHTSTT